MHPPFTLNFEIISYCDSHHKILKAKVQQIVVYKSGFVVKANDKQSRFLEYQIFCFVPNRAILLQTLRRSDK